MLERARSTENIEFKTPFVVEEFLAGDNGALDRARLRNVETGETEELPMDGAFIAIGHEPQSEIVEGIVDTDDDGYVVDRGQVHAHQRPGRVRRRRPRRPHLPPGVTAAGSGCQAALDAEWYLRDNPAVPTPAALEGTGDLAEQQWAPER